MKKNKNRGISLLEVIIAVSITTLLLLVTINITATSITTLREIQVRNSLYSNVEYMLTTLRHTVYQAELLTKVTDTELLVRYPDYTTDTVNLVSGTIYISGNPVTQSDVTVTYLKFKLVDDSVRVGFRVETNDTSTYTFISTTTIAARN